MPQSSTSQVDPSQYNVARRVASVTAVVPVRNEEEHIARTLDQLVDQKLDGIELEIIVVDGESSDRTQEIVTCYVDTYSHVRLLRNPKRLSSAARNLAIAESEGDYFVVIDGHCEIPSRSYFIDLVRAFEESGADCLGRPQPLDVTHATPLQMAIALARSSRLGHHPESFIYSEQPQFVPAKSVAIAYRRNVFEKVGHFDENFDAHEDGEFNYRCDQAEMKCYLDPQLTVKYFPRNSLGGLFRQLMRYGRGRVRLLRKHGGKVTFATAMPAVFVFGLVLGPLFCVLVPRLWTFYFSAITIYLLITVLESLRLAWGFRRPSLFGRLLIVFWTIHIGSGCGLIMDLLPKCKCLGRKVP